MVGIISLYSILSHMGLLHMVYYGLLLVVALVVVVEIRFSAPGRSALKWANLW